jgi:hypothetical protein
MTARIPSFSRDDPAADIAEALRREGTAIVRNLLPPEAMDTLFARLEPELEAQEPGGGAFVGNRARAVGRLFARGRVFSEHLLLNPRLLEVADAILLPQCPMAPSAPAPEPLPDDWADTYAYMVQARDPVRGPNCHHYRVNAAVAMQVCGGGALQPLHRETDIFRPFMDHDPARPECILASNWAVDEFTLENGATRVVPGSHRWPQDRVAEEHEVARAVMPKGSVVFWMGGTLHGLGVNRSDEPRTGIVCTLVVDWLTPEENTYFAVPPEIARSLPERAQQLLGYRSSISLGCVAGRASENWLAEESEIGS